ncbi:hypothetical protein GCM10027443_41250 [Pontibacter brevis]
MTRLLKALLLLPAYLLCTAVLAQDLILTKSGGEIIGKVVHIGADTVVYRFFNDTSGPVYTLPRQEVAHVKRMNASNPTSAPEVSFEQEALDLQERQELILQARLDAKAYYKGKGVFWTTMGSTIFNPLAGFATGTVISTVRPNVESGYNPNRHLLKDPVYRNSYEEQAHRRKIGKVAGGFGAGVAVVSILYVMVSNARGLY